MLDVVDEAGPTGEAGRSPASAMNAVLDAAASQAQVSCDGRWVCAPAMRAALLVPVVVALALADFAAETLRSSNLRACGHRGITGQRHVKHRALGVVQRRSCWRSTSPPSCVVLQRGQFVADGGRVPRGLEAQGPVAWRTSPHTRASEQSPNWSQSTHKQPGEPPPRYHVDPSFRRLRTSTSASGFPNGPFGPVRPKYVKYASSPANRVQPV